MTEQLREDLLELKAQHTGLAATCTSMNLKLCRLDRELFGNGRPGLVTQVAKMQQSVKVLLWVSSTLGGAIFTALAGIFVKMVVG